MSWPSIFPALMAEAHGSRVVERPELLSAVVGRAGRHGIGAAVARLRELTLAGTYWFPPVRFNISPLDGIDSPRPVEAQLFFESNRRWTTTMHRSLEGCAAVKVEEIPCARR